MAAVKFPKGSEEWMMFTEFWGICQKYWIPENTDEYWESLIDETNEFAEKYKGEFANKLAIAFIESMEKKSKE